MDDLADAYDAIRQGQAPALAAVPVSPDQWVQALARRAEDPAVRAAARVWQEQVAKDAAAAGAAASAELPVDFPGARNLESTASTVSIVLEPERTRLLRQLSGDGDQDAVLLSALGRAVSMWSGRDTTWVSLERHGREMADEDLDLSRTVGWLTTVFPFRLTCDRSLPMTDLVADVRTQLRRVPADAWLYGHLRYGDAGDADDADDGDDRADRDDAGDDGARLAAAPRPAISFNNLGRVRRTASRQLPLALVDGPVGPLRSPHAHRQHVIDVTVTTVEDTLTIVITYSAALHARRTIAHLGEQMLTMLEEMCGTAAV